MIIGVLDQASERINELIAKCNKATAERDAALAAIERLQGRIEAHEKREQAAYDDAMHAHRWFAKHFGEIMNGRDFAVKTEMADDAMRELQAAPQQSAVLIAQDSEE